MHSYQRCNHYKLSTRAEPTNNHTAGIDTYHSTIFTLLQNSTLYVNKGGCSSNSNIVPAKFLHVITKCTLPFGQPVKSDHN